MWVPSIPNGTNKYDLPIDLPAGLKFVVTVWGQSGVEYAGTTDVLSKPQCLTDRSRLTFSRPAVPQQDDVVLPEQLADQRPVHVRVQHQRLARLPPAAVLEPDTVVADVARERDRQWLRYGYTDGQLDDGAAGRAASPGH